MEHSKSEYKRLSIQNPIAMAEELYRLNEEVRSKNKTIDQLNKLSDLQSLVIETLQEEIITVTLTEEGECVAVTKQDEDHQILKVIWEKK